jgi:hypothetical protein
LVAQRLLIPVTASRTDSTIAVIVSRIAWMKKVIALIAVWTGSQTAQMLPGVIALPIVSIAKATRSTGAWIAEARTSTGVMIVAARKSTAVTTGAPIDAIVAGNLHHRLGKRKGGHWPPFPLQLQVGAALAATT